jgi:hypothetical protein
MLSKGLLGLNAQQGIIRLKCLASKVIHRLPWFFFRPPAPLPSKPIPTPIGTGFLFSQVKVATGSTGMVVLQVQSFRQ